MRISGVRDCSTVRQTEPHTPDTNRNQRSSTDPEHRLRCTTGTRYTPHVLRTLIHMIYTCRWYICSTSLLRNISATEVPKGIQAGRMSTASSAAAISTLANKNKTRNTTNNAESMASLRNRHGTQSPLRPPRKDCCCCGPCRRLLLVLLCIALRGTSSTTPAHLDACSRAVGSINRGSNCTEWWS